MEEKKIKLNNRNTMLRNNIIFSGVLKAVSLCTSFLVVPVTLDYLDKEPYGLWMAISSMAFWIYTFDI
jgi:O-antigen/teichoic acid export membrane protein